MCVFTRVQQAHKVRAKEVSRPFSRSGWCAARCVGQTDATNTTTCCSATLETVITLRFTLLPGECNMSKNNKAVVESVEDVAGCSGKRRQQPRHPEATRNCVSWHPATDCKWFPAIPLTSVRASQSNQHKVNIQRDCQAFRRNESNEALELRAREKTPPRRPPPPLHHWVRMPHPRRCCAPAAFLTCADGSRPPAINVPSSPADISSPWPGGACKSHEARGGEGNSSHFQTWGQQISIWGLHDQRWSRSTFTGPPHLDWGQCPEIPHAWRQRQCRLRPTLSRSLCWTRSVFLTPPLTRRLKPSDGNSGCAAAVRCVHVEEVLRRQRVGLGGSLGLLLWPGAPTARQGDLLQCFKLLQVSSCLLKHHSRHSWSRCIHVFFSHYIYASKKKNHNWLNAVYLLAFIKWTFTRIADLLHFPPISSFGQNRWWRWEHLSSILCNIMVVDKGGLAASYLEHQFQVAFLQLHNN